MKFAPFPYFETTISEAIKELLDIDINDPEYSETFYNIYKLEEPERFFVSFQGDIGIKRDDFLLYWISYSYSYSDKTFEEIADVKISEAFPEHLSLFNMEVKNPTR